MQIASIGPLAPHPDVDEWLISTPVALPCRRGATVKFVFDSRQDIQSREIDAALRGLLAATESLFFAAEEPIVQYCNDMLGLLDDEERPRIEMRSRSDIWNYIRWGEEWMVSLRKDGDSEDGVYISIECNCDWEIEHGLQIVIKDGARVTKVGPYDGHVTNADAYGDEGMIGVVYRRIGS